MMSLNFYISLEKMIPESYIDWSPSLVEALEPIHNISFHELCGEFVFSYCGKPKSHLDPFLKPDPKIFKDFR